MSVLCWLLILSALLSNFRPTILWFIGLALSIAALALAGRWFHRQSRSIFD